jgi:hypothetical protein
MRRIVSWIGFSIGFIFIITILVAAGWRLVSPLLVDRSVDEPLPFDLPLPILATALPTTEFPTDEEVGIILPPSATVTATEALTATPTFTPAVTATKTITATPVVTATGEATVTLDTVTDDTSSGTPSVLGQGSFVDGDAIHRGSGLATLYRAPDSSYLLRLDDFATTNGPDVHVLLSPNANPTDHDSLGEYLDLGEIKGTIGDQNYPLPADFDPTLYKSVVIHCLAFKVIFATATLE